MGATVLLLVNMTSKTWPLVKYESNGLVPREYGPRGLVPNEYEPPRPCPCRLNMAFKAWCLVDPKSWPPGPGKYGRQGLILDEYGIECIQSLIKRPPRPGLGQMKLNHCC